MLKLDIPDTHTSRTIKYVLSLFPKEKCNFWIAGGSALKLLTGEELGKSDVDIFCKTKDDYEKILKHFETKTTPSKATKSAISFSVKTDLDKSVDIQIICRKYYDNLEKLFKDFDFTVCQIASDGEFIYCSKQTYTDIYNKSLRLIDNSSANMKNIHWRFSKYLRKGFEPTGDTLSKVVELALTHRPLLSDTIIGSNAFEEYCFAEDKPKNFKKVYKPFCASWPIKSV